MLTSNVHCLTLACVGSIPEDIGSLSRLRYLGISNNKFGGALPIGISKLRSLKYLNASFNEDLVGVLPAEYARCINLEEIYLQGTALDCTAKGRQ